MALCPCAGVSLVLLLAHTQFPSASVSLVLFKTTLDANPVFTLSEGQEREQAARTVMLIEQR